MKRYGVVWSKATDVVCFLKFLVLSSLSQGKKDKTKSEQLFQCNITKQYADFFVLYILSATAKRLKEKDQREVTLVFRFMMWYFFVFFLPWLNIMDNFKKHVLHADCDFKEICVTHVHELHCQKILMYTEDKNPLFIFKTFCR